MATAKKVKPLDNVEIEWTAKSKFHQAGERSMVHKMQAEKHIASGSAKLVKDGKAESTPAAGKGGDAQV